MECRFQITVRRGEGREGRENTLKRIEKNPFHYIMYRINRFTVNIMEK